MTPSAARRLLVAVAVIGAAGMAQAHTGSRAFILLLPTQRYMVGGTLVVALSFVAMALLPSAGLRALGGVRWRLGKLPRGGRVGPSLASLCVVLGLVVAGYAGSRDPLMNPLPLMVWSLWWIGLTFLSAVFGDLWALLNPWRGIYRLLSLLPGLQGGQGRLAYPRWLGHWPAVLLFFGFAWFELIHPAPQDPDRLAGAVGVYLAATLVGMLLFGGRTWLRHGECFSVFFRIVGWLSPLDPAPATDAGSGERLVVTLPGARLLRVGVLPASGVAFVLLALASVSFDGLSRTFWWLDLVGVNPLEYPGRSALVAANSLGLLAVFCVLVGVYVVAVLLGRALAGGKGYGESLGRFVVSIVPIAFGYHFAHYLPTFLVDAQYAVRALSDPWALGWNLFGTGGLHVTTSFLANHHSVEVIWNIQVVGIVAAHVAAVVIAHLLALGAADDARRAVLGQAPMTLLMIGYTLFGLWLLAAPAVG